MAAALTTIRPRTALEEFFREIRPRKTRSILEFAEQELIIPDGPYAGRLFRATRQPYTRLWLDAIARAKGWNRFAACGPTQSGKTLTAFIIPTLYHLFELRETVICGVPDLDMAADKWHIDLLPAIERSRYRDLLPRSGAGSKGGTVRAIHFRHGPTLRFMTGGGSDKSRAGFTSRVVVITETDGMDTPLSTSREADRITQIEARTRAFGARRRIYLECTVSTEEGRIWTEYIQGTRSHLWMRCPRCNQYVPSPEREHLRGWQNAQTEAEARRLAHFVCPGCDAAWSDDDRRKANQDMVLVHQGQHINRRGRVVGAVPETMTFGFRWSAVHNLFLNAGDLGAEEWKGRHAVDDEMAERSLRQFVWCMPVAVDPEEAGGPVPDAITGRTRAIARGVVPPNAETVTAALDLGKFLCHWVVLAWLDDGSGHVVDYGRIDVASDDLGVERGLELAIEEFAEIIRGGFPSGAADGDLIFPVEAWIDAGYMAPIVYGFCRVHDLPFRPVIGRGAGQRRERYHQPRTTGNIVKHVGEGYHLTHLAAERILLVELDADFWKTAVHSRITMPLDRPGAISLFAAAPAEHFAFAKHLTAETRREEYVPGKGVVVRWHRIRRQNHWLDCVSYATAAAHLAGIRMAAMDAGTTRVPRKPRRAGMRIDRARLRTIPHH